MKNLVHKMKGFHKGQKGFTLIEVMVIVAILSIIVGLVLPNFTGMVDRAKTTMVQGQLEKAREACFSFHADTGTWPDEYSDNDANGYRQLTNGKQTSGDIIANWDGPYLERSFVTNQWGGVTRILYDDPRLAQWVGTHSFSIGGIATTGKDCYLGLDNMPREVCKTLDKAIDGTDDGYNGGMVIYHDDGSGRCLLGILISD
jgi:type II secretion system protein G